MKANYNSKKILENEVRKEVLRANAQYDRDHDAAMIYAIWQSTGLDAVELHKIWKTYIDQANKLKDHYALSTTDAPWICHQLLDRSLGISIDEWYNELEVQENETDK